jgi:hypothetical protein
MNTRMFSKLVFFAAAFLITGLMFAGVNYLFNEHMNESTARASLAWRADSTRLGATLPRCNPLNCAPMARRT